jgi:hypothetical protein
MGTLGRGGGISFMGREEDKGRQGYVERWAERGRDSA